ncbi:hypothetical protein [Marinimicrobium locisalis]|uniref:hypothetical protein n=1 Tax=Marinimicrobium locisalis TaxID=546022 RepID=UPI0032219B97
MTRMGTLGVLLLSLVGCTLIQNDRQSQAPSEVNSPLDCPVVLQRRSEPKVEPANTANALLGFRRVQCARPKEERDALIQDYLEQSSRQAVMRTLMLASCAPDQTPGLLANALVQARDMEPHAKDVAALLDLLAAQAESYALLERRLHSTQKKLDDMIQGIRAIEAEMGEASDGADTSGQRGAQP